MDTEVVAVFQEGGKPRLDPAHPHASVFQEMMRAGDFAGKYGTLQFIRFGGFWENGEQKGTRSRNLLFAGLGSASDFTEERARSLGGHVFNRLHAERVDEGRIVAEPFSAWSLGTVRAFAEGVMLAAYQFGKYKSLPAAQAGGKKSGAKKNAGSSAEGPLLHLVCETRTESHQEELAKRLLETRWLVEAVNLARDLSNEPSNIAHPDFIAKQARELARRHGLRIRVINEEEAARLGMNLFLAVGQGSHRETCVVVLEYVPRAVKGGKKDVKTLALVGKGVTFDSGGISIKPALRMEDMKHDMSGAAAVLATVALASKLKLKNRVVGFLALTENMPGGRAVQPGNVIRARNGKTVEIVNTDAEGRLILADVLDLAHTYEPDAIIDIATLTGAVSTALGKHCAAILGNDQRLVDRVKRAADGTGEKLWQLPLWDEYLEDLRSDTADLKNTGNDPLGGTIRAAAFLNQFVRKDMPWAHLDIAAMANGVPHHSYIPKRGATGLYVRTLVRLAQEF